VPVAEPEHHLRTGSARLPARSAPAAGATRCRPAAATWRVCRAGPATAETGAAKGVRPRALDLGVDAHHL